MKYEFRFNGEQKIILSPTDNLEIEFLKALMSGGVVVVELTANANSPHELIIRKKTNES